MKITPELLEVEYRGEYRVWLRFADGCQGETDLGDNLWGEVFEPLRDQQAFARLSLDPVLGTIVWPNGADLAPEFLYGRVAGS